MIEIVKGELVEFVVVIETSEGERKDLTDFDEYKVCFGGFEVTHVASANDSIVTLNGSADKGELLVTVTPTDSETLQSGSRQDISVEIAKSSDANARERYIISQEVTIRDFGC